MGRANQGERHAHRMSTIRGMCQILQRRQFMQLAAATALSNVVLAGSSGIASAQAFPTRALRWLVPFAPGGSTDIIARLVGGYLSERLGQTVVIENKPGANTQIGTQAVVTSPADGYTLLFISTSAATNVTFYDNLPYNFLRDIAPVSGLVRSPFILTVSQNVPATTIAEFITYAKANPGKINMASTGVGTSPHLAGELFQVMTGTKMFNVPYRGEAPAMNDMIAGQAQVIFGSPAGTLPHIQSGSLRPLGVTGAQRIAALPQVPSIGDTVVGYEATTFYGVGAPKNTPAEIVDKLNREIKAALTSPAISARIAEFGSALTMSPAEFGQLIADETEKWGKVIRSANIKPG
jgi:tripartite-type tricarboxylate transporter receptor subunit TctC